MPVIEAAPGETHASSLIIPSYAESLVWQRNKQLAGTGMVRAIRFISWLNKGLTPEQISGLLEDDRAAHEEAKETGELLFYEAAEIDIDAWSDADDDPTPLPEELEFKENSCGWSSIEASQIALHGIRHRRAKMNAIRNNVYDEVRIEVLDSTYIGDGEYEFELVRTMNKDDILEHARIEKLSKKSLPYRDV